MKVLHLISSGGMYGAEAVILALTRALTRGGEHGSEIAVFDHGATEAPMLFEVAQRAGLKAHRLPCHGQMDPGFTSRLRQFVRDSDAQVLHTHGYKADLYAAMAFAGRRRRPALVSTCHTWYDNDLAVRLYGAADRFALRGFEEVVAVSEEVRCRLLASGVGANSVSLIRNGVDLDRLLQFAETRSYGSLGKPLTVGLVGRLAPEKGIDLFLDVATAIVSEDSAVQFVVAGDGPERGALEQRFEPLQRHGRVHLLGAVADMPVFYGSLDVLVSASRQEGLPMALLEGMAAGLPVVATAVGAVPELVEHEGTGLLVAPEQPAALRAAVERLLASPELRGEFGRAGRRRVEEQFSARRMAEDYLKVYQRGLARLAKAA